MVSGLTFEQFITLLGILTAGIGAVWALFAKKIIPARLEQQQREFNARLDEQQKRLDVELEQARKRLDSEIEQGRDDREHQQEQSNLERAYHLSEGAVAQQMLAELLADSQEEKKEVNQYIRQEIKELLGDIKDDTGMLRKMSEDTQKTKYEIRNLTTQQRILIGLITEIYQDFIKKRPTNEDNEQG